MCDPKESGIQKAVQAFGSQAALARYLGVNRQAVHEWLSKGAVPPKRVPEILRRCPDLSVAELVGIEERRE